VGFCPTGFARVRLLVMGEGSAAAGLERQAGQDVFAGGGCDCRVHSKSGPGSEIGYDSRGGMSTGT
jgi:hypothetical protein